MTASTLTFGNQNSDRVEDVLDPLDRALARGTVTGWEECAKAIQAEVVRRAPVGTGNLRDAFASSDAIAEADDYGWRFGLLTEALQEKAYYWRFVEYGTSPHRAGEVRYYRVRRKELHPVSSESGKRIGRPPKASRFVTRRKVYDRFSRGRRPQPFVRPGIIAGRRKFIDIMSKMIAIAVSRFVGGGGLGAGGAVARIFALQLHDLERKRNEADRER